MAAPFLELSVSLQQLGVPKAKGSRDPGYLFPITRNPAG
jgi:hypothetical protein